MLLVFWKNIKFIYMKKIKQIILTIAFIISPIITTTPVHAIKIGLVENTQQVSIGTSKEAELISPIHNKSFYKLKPMKAYPFKATDNTISIEIQNQWFKV